MFTPTLDRTAVNRRVRAILITDEKKVLFIKRIKPNKSTPYWVAPGGGVEDDDDSLLDALDRELEEELGASYEIIETGFVLEHRKANKELEEHFYVCRLHSYDLSQRHGPEFDDPSRGQYIPDEIDLNVEAIEALNIKTIELRDWLLNNLDHLRDLV
jgi:8-oxo-dGTP pyrophosphatase MutT (NUDIX family)